ncbi:hypothetical protein [Listeria phage LMTA-34]|uniref:Uncharacterized protein n=2 Tax=Pecentumvirus TaxID=1857844 RepID=A0A060ALP1_9CAUD|nr:exopolyphosphatase [Listeria phage LMSP-25]YP_009616272.1 exopolyphosphatase [Listeria phage LMTA-34]AIA64512.1 hypothetical protein [Listeria phage LMSP-25]AID17070.1 hypothetical protein [Listeria phage LMTA-34]
MIQLITKNNMQGYYADYLLRKVSTHEVRTTYLEKFRLQDITSYSADATIIIVLGFSYSDREAGATVSNFEEYSATFNNPFTFFYHFASFGDKFKYPNIDSLVDEKISPVMVMYNTLKEKNPDFLIAEKDKEAMLIATAVDDYHCYRFAETGNGLSLPLKELGDLYGRYLADLYGSMPLVELIQSNKTIIKVRQEYRNYYIKKKIEQSKRQLVKDVMLYFVYAEEYENEIAHHIIDKAKEVNDRVLVLVGKHTTNNDMFHVRSHNIHAGEVAKLINKGSGKESTAVVFLGDSKTPTFNAVVKVLLDASDI